MARITETVSTEELQAEIERLRAEVAKLQFSDIEAVAAEREACAQVAENWYKSAGNHVGTLIAAAIRGREDGA